MPQYKKSLVWFRRDLRSFDHAALHHALVQSEQVFCVFIFDTDILGELRESGITCDRRVEFILASVMELEAELRQLGGVLLVRHAQAASAIPMIAAELGADAVFANGDYEPAALRRDLQVARALELEGREFLTFKDQVIFEKNEVLSLAGKPFSVFTPYKNAWLKKLFPGPGWEMSSPQLDSYAIEPYAMNLAPPEGASDVGIPSLEQLGFMPTNLSELPLPPAMSGGERLLEEFMPRLSRYKIARDFPGIYGTSRLSVHLRFGTVSVRSLVRRAAEAMQTGDGGEGAAVWLSELVWRDFYFMILYQHPQVVSHSFKPEYERIAWESGPEAEAAFQAWCEGRTGYPLVDAAMAQLNQTGFMHNRLRMVSASFLIKDLGIDWRRGERYFAMQLNDYDLSANNGGWQWAASSGCDAQPYFRIFNPVTQSERFDPQGKFIRHYLPALSKLNDKSIHAPWLASTSDLQAAGIELGRHYPLPIVQHDEARRRTLQRYEVVKK